MLRVPVVSANLLEVGYDFVNRELEVVFRAAPRWTYLYEHVPPLTYSRLLAAGSVGTFFNQQIRSHPERYPYTRRKAR